VRLKTVELIEEESSWVLVERFRLTLYIVARLGDGVAASQVIIDEPDAFKHSVSLPPRHTTLLD
jgi:hypothetical protein